MTIKEQQQDKKRHVKIACDELGISQTEYTFFAGVGNKLNRIYTDECNGKLKEGVYDILTKPIYNFTDNRAKALGLHIFYQTDPRGATVYLSKKPISDHDYNRMGCFCIY